MTIDIRTTNIPDNEVLRTLIVNSLPSIMEDCNIIDANVPLPGNPILASNLYNQAYFIFFDLHNAQQTLMSGLSAMEQIKQQRRLISRLYSQLDALEHSTLVIMTSAEIQVDYSYFQKDGSILFYTFRGLNINDERAVLIQPCLFNDDADEKNNKKNGKKIEHNFMEMLETSLLSDDENEFFSEP